MFKPSITSTIHSTSQSVMYSICLNVADSSTNNANKDSEDSKTTLLVQKTLKKLQNSEFNLAVQSKEKSKLATYPLLEWCFVKIEDMRTQQKKIISATVIKETAKTEKSKLQELSKTYNSNDLYPRYSLIEEEYDRIQNNCDTEGNTWTLQNKGINPLPKEVNRMIAEHSQKTAEDNLSKRATKGKQAAATAAVATIALLSVGAYLYSRKAQ